jgi:hypothetical protein
MGDNFGALIAQTLDEDAKPIGLARFAGPAEVAPWRYEPWASIGRPAQGSDGTIYVVESQLGEDNHGDPIWDGSVAVIDGTTGRLRARVPVPRDFVEEACGADHWEMPRIMTTPVVGADGFGYVQVRRRTRVDGGTCNGTYIPTAYDNQVQLLRVSPTGEAMWTVLYQFTGATDPWWPVLGQTVPDGLGGILTTWKRYQTAGAEEWNVTRFDVEGIRADYPASEGAVIMLTGADKTAFVFSDDMVKAIDVTTWTPQWTVAAAGSPIMALADGGVALYDSFAGVVNTWDGAGIANGTSSLFIQAPTQLRLGLWTGLADWTTSPRTAAYVSPTLNEDVVSFSVPAGGGPRSQNVRRTNFFDTREEAAVAALQHLEPVTNWTRSEWGGLICQKSNGFVWSMFKTDFDPGTVTIPSDLCNSNNTIAARFHTHPLPFGQQTPSGDDLANVNSFPGVPFYFRVPKADVAGQTPSRMQFLKTWRGAGNLAPQNICSSNDGINWSDFYQTGQAICQTPSP